MIVLDASAWVAALIDSAPAGQAARRAIAADPELVVPAHCRLEVVRTLGKYEQTGTFTEPALSALFEAVLAAEVREVAADARLLRMAWRWRHNVSTYDAPYVVLAQLYDASLVTCDARLARAADALGVATQLTV